MTSRKSSCGIQTDGFVGYGGGVIDDKDDLAKLCAAADSGGNLRGIEAEENATEDRNRARL